MSAIEIRNLTKKYKDTVAVDSLNLTIEKGELFSLLGTNGAGKSTTVKMLSTLLRCDSGDAFLFSKSVFTESDAVKPYIAVSPQETAIAKNLSVKENLEMICGCYSYSRELTEAKISELVHEFSLSDLINKRAGKLSGGYQRRLSIAMALISEPKILFLDEPTLGLDVISRSELWDTIRALKGRVTIVLTTHYMEEAEALSDRIGIMDKGRLIALGTAKELMEQTGCERFEAAFISIVKGAKI
jgi:ABC-2 type transport system ATP-binding protein